jgi:hypothetical protein
MRTKGRPVASAIDWPSEVLPTPGGPARQRIVPRLVARELEHGHVLEDALLHLVEAVVVVVELLGDEVASMSAIHSCG